MSEPGTWEFWIDRGGTFTDVIGCDPDRNLHALKLLSTNPERYADAAVQGIRMLLGVGEHEPLPSSRVAAVKMGTTVATNALLERKGAPTLLAITAGHADALRIGTQHRPRLFDRQIVLPSMLYSTVTEIDERVDARGQVLTPIDAEQVRAALAPARAAGIEAIAIVLMHGWQFTAHEQQVARIARELGFTQVSVSHRVSPMRKLIGRGDTTVVDAYLSPILRHYVDRISAALGGVDLQFMQSNGGLIDAARFQGKDAILSGPAGGIVGAVVTSGQAGFDRIIGFDMGGTSTDVAHYAGSFERSFETTLAGVRLRAPMLEVHTVAAGGGSICRFEQGRYRVGPESAGADPGPACYRRGGPLTVTDCNVMLGKLHAELFPRLFGPSGCEPIDVEVVQRRFAALADAIATASGDRRSPVEVAEGFVEIAVANMAEAIAKISIERGHDLDDHALCCFGGAAGQHACLVADALGMRTVVIHPLAGVLSAYGMGLADVRLLRERSLGVELDADALVIARRWLDELGREALAELSRSERVSRSESVQLSERVHLRYEGSDRALPIDWIADADALRERFEDAHLERYGFELPREPVVLELLAVEACIAGEPLAARVALAAETPTPTPLLVTQAHMAGCDWPTPVYRREQLGVGAKLIGPAIIADANATTVVEPQWQAEVRPSGHLVLERRVPRADRVVGDLRAELERPDPVRLELFNNLFGSIAEQMGVALCNTAHSVNIKERLDFSCAVFDREGHLIANAPHMPVHLGSMGASVRAVIGNRGASVRAGDAYLVNAPYNGGTHLPDLTVISPVFLGAGAGPDGGPDEGPDFWVASRGHHADIGGITPGSMPANSSHVDEEGVLFDDFLLVEQGHVRRLHLREKLLGGRWPARDPEQNLADLEAQLAANHRGVQELARVVEHWSLARVHAYMGHIRRNAAAAVSEAIRGLASQGLARGAQAGPRRFSYRMDDGSEIVVAITLEGESGRCKVDFSGTSPQRPNNFNAPRAVCQAAVLYVFRSLVDAEIPLNEGCLDPIELVIPPGSMLDPAYPAAVVAGNVETSQVICDALYGALGVMAAAQGTMNNVTFGDAIKQYYETVCGGSGAGPGFDGCDAVHTHMTNSRLTDPEVLEERYPVVLERFEIRRGSGGRGRWRGGDGVRRVLRFSAPMQLVVLANRRVVAPFGMAGGEAGALGKNWVERADGSREELGSSGALQVERGDLFVLETPGGGGWGEPQGA